MDYAKRVELPSLNSYAKKIYSSSYTKKVYWQY